MRLKGQVGIVTGSGSGIGQATALLFAEEGAKVVVVDVDRTLGQETLTRIRQQGGECLYVNADISKEEEVKAMVEETRRTYGTIDVLVNNAAVFVLKGLEATVEDWQRSLSVNVIGTALCSKYAVEVMKQRRHGAIVNLGSISSFVAQPEFITYSATKAAIVQMTRNMAMDLAPYNIRVNCVCPGSILTPICYRVVDQAGITLQEFEAQQGPLHLLNRMGQPREVANAILFLASEEASFITGSPLMVDGGYTAK